MADTKITDLSSAGTILGTDVTNVVRSGTDYKTTVTDITTYVSGALVEKERIVTFQIPGTLATGDGTGLGTRGFLVPSIYNGKNLVSCVAVVETAGTSGSANLFQVRRVRSASPVDMLSTRIMIDAGEVSSTTAATAYVINTSNDDVATGDVIYIDVDQLNTTPPTTLTVYLGFV